MKIKVKKIMAVMLIVTLVSGCSLRSSGYPYKQDLNVIDDNYRTYYEVFLYSFCDSNQDGIGDINGLISKLDYINDGDDSTDTDLGCNGLWLMPIMPSTTYHKYDVIDYYNIDKEYGTMDDFKNLLAQCNQRGIKVIIDLVLNHTSTQNEWFVKATDYLKTLKKGEKPSVKDCPYVGYYNFTKEEGEPNYYQIDGTDWYYEAVFWDQMPDLNLGNKELRKEIEKIADYWLDLGVGGFRLDAAKEYYSGDNEENIKVLTWFNNYVKEKKKDAYIVGEVWEKAAIYKDYYESGIDSVFNFSFGTQEGIITKTLNSEDENKGVTFASAMDNIQDMLLEVNANAIDAPFFTNHDTGRAAAYMSYDANKVKMAWAMNLLMSGSAFLYYGEELGMSGSGIDENKRAPMYWSKTDTTGMTKGPENMEAVEHQFPPLDEQQKEEGSIYNYIKRIIRLRNENPEIARGTVAVMEDIEESGICGVTKTYNDHQIEVLYNLSGESKTFSVSKEKYGYTGIRGYANGEEGNKEAKVTLDGEKVTLPAYSVVILSDND